MQNGKNDWQYWTTYIQDKNNTVWKATLNVAESANGVKYLYDINPIKKVGQSVKSDTSTTSVGQSVKSDTSTTGDIVAQNQTESQAQIRSSTLSAGFNIRLCKGQRPSHSLIFLCGGPGYEENDRSENA